MQALLITKKFQDKKNGPVYNTDDLWVGENDRADKIIEADYGKVATKDDIQKQLDIDGIEYDTKLKRDELIELLKGE